MQKSKYFFIFLKEIHLQIGLSISFLENVRINKIGYT